MTRNKVHGPISSFFVPRGGLLWLFPLFILLSPQQAKAAREVMGKSAPEIVFQMDVIRSVRLSEFRGKWVLLHCGGAWNRNSQFTGQVFAHMRRALDGKPVVFVDVFDDPTFLDMDLFSFSTPADFRVRVEKSRDLSLFRPSRLPAWYVIDPAGIVQAAGGLDQPDSLRKKVAGVLATDPDFHNVSLVPGPSESALERTMYLYIEKHYAESEAGAAGILATDPHNELAMVFLHFAESWTKGYDGAEKDLDERIKNHVPSDRLLIYLTLYRHLRHDNAATRAAIRSFADRYPESRYLKCLQIYLDRLPESLTRQEEDLLVTSKNTVLDEHLGIYRGYVLQSQGNHDQAERLFRRIRSPKNLALLPILSSLIRQGRTESASQVLEFPRDLTPDNAGPVDAWRKMHSESVLGRWEEAARYAARYQTVRPEKLQGFLVEWLAALVVQGQTSRGEELSRKSEEFAKSSDRYGMAARCLAKNVFPSVEEIASLDDGNIRFDTAMFFVLRQWQSAGPDAAVASLAAFQPAFDACDWQYALLEHLRTFSIPFLRCGASSR